MDADQVAQEIGFADKATWGFNILENLAGNQPESFEKVSGDSPLEAGFRAI